MVSPTTLPTRGRTARLLLALALAAATVVAAISPVVAKKPANPPGALIDLQLLAFNDYHGHLEPNTPGPVGSTPAGGAEYLATKLAELRAGHEYSLTVAAGDLIGGSPFLSGLFHDEPSVESLNAMGLDVSGVGNHEFDEGVTELLRMQNGGCHPVDGCYFEDAPYAGADFPWLAANVTNDETGETALPPYWIQKFEGVKVAFIGMTLEGTDLLVAGAGIRGWSFQDEADTANALIPELKAQDVEAMVVLLHEGGTQTATDVDGCVGVGDPIADIQARLDPEIDILVTGHTHQPYNCVMTDPAGQPRRVTSAFSFGRIVSEINVVLDRRTKEVRRDLTTATNHIVDQTTLARDPAQTAILDKWRPLSDPIGNREVGTISADIKRKFETGGSDDRGAESDAGNMIADAMLWRTTGDGAQIAFMNPGGVRADLIYAESAGEGDGVVTYREAFNVQNFGNLLQILPVTGDQIRQALIQQCNLTRHFNLGVSEGFTYDVKRTIDPANSRRCLAIEVSNIRLHGVPLDMEATYMVTLPQFVADGNDGFSIFKDIPVEDRIGAGVDLDALIGYLDAEGPVAPPGTDRVNELP